MKNNQGENVGVFTVQKVFVWKIAQANRNERNGEGAWPSTETGA
jgi:hypothetical protein